METGTKLSIHALNICSLIVGCQSCHGHLPERVCMCIYICMCGFLHCVSISMIGTLTTSDPLCWHCKYANWNSSFWCDISHFVHVWRKTMVGKEMEGGACITGLGGVWLKHFIRIRIHFVTRLRANPKTILKVGKQDLINFTSSPQCWLMSFLALINPVIFSSTTVNNTSHTSATGKTQPLFIWQPVAVIRLSYKQTQRAELPRRPLKTSSKTKKK